VEQADAMRRDFVANVSHEIRTPLTVVAGFLETIQTLPLHDAERSRYLDLMAAQTRRMQMLVTDLLTLSGLEGKPPASRTETLGGEELMRQLQAEAGALSAARGASAEPQHVFSFEGGPGLEILCEPGELISAASNLLSNAVRYTPPGGRIDVRLLPQADGRLRFGVRDNGPGIAPEHIPRLTERFYRVDRSRSRDTGGTGLGLAIVKHVVQRHGADLLIDSKPGQGSEFCMMLPEARWRRLT
ncbi:MAG: PAS domain-containing sensor histidine kinase, partial [Rhodoferax sp.]|nr:PAS domain-containing sensor histidine kinase [Rhodoferax sp.]